MPQPIAAGLVMSRRGGRRRLAIGLALLAFGSACTGTTGHLALVSTRDVSPRDLAEPQPGRHVIGRSCVRVVGIVPTGWPNFGDALAEALRASGAAYLTDARVGYEIRYLPLIYGWACYVIEGDAR